MQRRRESDLVPFDLEIIRNFEEFEEVNSWNGHNGRRRH